MAQQPDDSAFESLVQYIQERRGIDFRGYKRTSLRRRLGLRMERLKIDGFEAYNAFLEAHPQELTELLNTVLINVTSFFRDPEAWQALDTDVLPVLLSSDRGDGALRIWSAGCSSGEEPYSIAMLLAERLGLEGFSRRVKIYATDLDEAALAVARNATYSARAVETVPAALLGKYFDRTNSHYAVNRELRKSVIFGRHNIIYDAPISRVDLLICRNLLIYLETEAQNVVLPRLHYALMNDGYLFLGKAETQLARSKLFRPVDLRHRLFRKVPQEWRRMTGGSVILGGSPAGPAGLQPRLLDAIIDTTHAAYLAIDQDDTLIFANPAARRMLEVGEADLGRPFQDLPISYRPTELRSHIDEARQQNRPIRIEHQEYYRPPADPVRLTIEARPLHAPDGQLFATLLVFSDTTRMFQLQQELEAAQGSLSTMIEELQSANEELETTNEELQSTNEELETTNEELQSTNDELAVANEELRRHSDEARAYREHIESVLRSIDSGLIVLNLDTTIRSWNRWNENVWGLREEEVVGHRLSTVDSGFPLHEVQDVIDGAILRNKPDILLTDAIDRRGRTIRCRVRISPLLSSSRAVEGAVLVIEDISER